jgi:signal transduction histidine kinase
MGLDAFRPAWDRVFPLPVLRLAGDVVASALEREFLERDRAHDAPGTGAPHAMIGSLASGIAHNFNNIISAILGYSEMVEPQLTRGTKPAQHIDEIRRAAERGRDLIDNILTFGRQRDARARPVQVRTLFAEAASLLRASLPSGVELIIDDVPIDVAVSGEPAQLQQVILNLCTNARKRCRAADRSASLRSEEVAAVLPMSHGELVPGRYVCLAVIDSGHGFDEVWRDDCSSHSSRPARRGPD